MGEHSPVHSVWDGLSFSIAFGIYWLLSSLQNNENVGYVRWTQAFQALTTGRNLQRDGAAHRISGCTIGKIQSFSRLPRHRLEPLSSAPFGRGSVRLQNLKATDESTPLWSYVNNQFTFYFLLFTFYFSPSLRLSYKWRGVDYE